MMVETPCSTKGCDIVHVAFAPGPGEYRSPAEPCFACAEKAARKSAADEFLNQKRKSK